MTDRVELKTGETGAEAPEPEPQEEVQPEPQRPEGLPEKFKTVEDLAKSYGELEKKLGQPKTEPTPTIEEVPLADYLDTLEAKYVDEGGLSEDDLKSLEDRGISRARWDRFLAGNAALQEKSQADLASVAGGMDGLNTVIAWAAEAENISEAEKLAYNRAVNSNDMDAAKLALRGIVAAYKDAMGQEPNLVTGVAMPRAVGARPFRSQAEMVAAIQDPKYDKDEAYRKDVEDRIAVTDL